MGDLLVALGVEPRALCADHAPHTGGHRRMLQRVQAHGDALEVVVACRQPRFEALDAGGIAIGVAHGHEPFEGVIKVAKHGHAKALHTLHQHNEPAQALVSNHVLRKLEVFG